MTLLQMFQCQKYMRSIWLGVCLRMVFFVVAVVIVSGHQMHFSTWDFIAVSTTFACLSSAQSLHPAMFSFWPSQFSSYTIIVSHFFCAFKLFHVHSPHPFNQKFSRFSISSKPWLDAGAVIGCRFAAGNKSVENFA